MGKDNHKPLLNSHGQNRLFSPWQLADTDMKNHRHQFGLFTKNGEFETSIIDEDMTQTILQIEREQLDRIERNRDEEEMEDKSLLTHTQRLDIHSSGINTQFFSDSLTSQQGLQPSLSKADQEMESIFFIPQGQQKALVTLEDIVFEKELPPLGAEPSLSTSNSQVIQVYTKIGEYLTRYQSGRLPKAFKIIPSLSNWDEILLLTKPQTWTPQATYEATKVFISTVKATQTKQFFQLVLLHNIRNNLLKNNQQQRLDIPLYLALQKAMTKSPALFLKGFLFPLCESGSCTILEASVIARVISQSRIPVLHSATALLKLSELPFTLSTSILVLIFLEKKQALPYRVVDALVSKYFFNMQQKGSEVVLPEIWFQSLYTFVRSYGVDLVPTQKRKLLELVQTIKPHDMSKAIEKAIAIKVTDEDDTAEEDDSDDPKQEYHVEFDDGSSGSDMAID